MNFWFDPKNDTKTKSDNATEKVDTSSVKLETGEDQQEGGSLKTDGDDEKETQSNGEGAHALSESGRNKDTHPEGQVKIDDRTKVSSEETTTEPEAEKEEAVEEDEKEIELSASQYIALLRETETSLFKATFSLKKVISFRALFNSFLKWYAWIGGKGKCLILPKKILYLFILIRLRDKTSIMISEENQRDFCLD